MSQRGRGSGPDDDDPDGEDAGRERAPGGSALPPATSRPIAPYDPYRPASGDLARRPTRNIAADAFEPPARPARTGDDDPFLPQDDPLSSKAWQLELDEAASRDIDDATLPEFDLDAPHPPRRPRRRPSSTRTTREAEPGAQKTLRRSRSIATGGARGRAAHTGVTISMPRVITGSSLVADQMALALVGINAASILVMVLLLVMRMSGIPSPTVLQLDAAGNPDLWGPPSVLWRLPLMSLFITILFLVVAWFLHPIDRFAARFALGAAMVAQLVAWVAVIQHLA
jgi:hypothetical protein